MSFKVKTFSQSLKDDVRHGKVWPVENPPVERIDHFALQITWQSK